MGTTPYLGLPELSQSQANPDVTVNEAVALLAAMLKGIEAIQNAPPGLPTEGDAYVVGTAGSGAWSGKNNCVAVYVGSSWRFIPGNDDNGTQIAMGANQEGLRVWHKGENRGYVWTGSAWEVQTAELVSATVAGLGSAAQAARMKYCTDETGGAVPVFSDGTDWRRVTDRAIAS